MRRRPAPRLRPWLALLLLASVALSSGAAVRAAESAAGPPPTPVPVPGGGTSPSPFPQALHTPDPSRRPPEVRAASAVLADLDSGQVLFAKSGDEQRAIASLTKIMTALLVLTRSSPTDPVTVSADAAGEDRTPGTSELGLEPGERIRVGQLLYALLLQSANDAAVALAEHVAGSVDAFVRLMNRRAELLGLRHTRFASPNGLDDMGYSTASDLATLTRVAERAPGFRSIVATRVHTVPGSPPRILQNRNALLWLYPGATGVKTGFTSAAGYCLVATAERQGLRLVAVLLGEPGEPFSDAAALFDYGFTAFERRDLVADGASLGTVRIDGHSVSVVAGAGVGDALVPAGTRVSRTLSIRSDVAYPPPRGTRVGTLLLRASGVELPSVPVVVAGVAQPPPPESGPWWRRAAGAVVHAVGSLFDALFG